jgi:hypothetical protein
MRDMPKPIDFDFAHVGDGVFMKEVSDPPVKVAHLVFVIDVAKGKHQPLMGDLLKLIDDLATDPLSRGVLAPEIRELFSSMSESSFMSRSNSASERLGLLRT